VAGNDWLSSMKEGDLVVFGINMPKFVGWGLSGISGAEGPILIHVEMI